MITILLLIASILVGAIIFHFSKGDADDHRIIAQDGPAFISFMGGFLFFVVSMNLAEYLGWLK